ncbi:hypothetical protein ERX37_08320 [Macrococcus hajekii]|uniref:YtkA-like domain-containing protein n=1 Tax=Macrococcus hajekii TaxID=198482 RepID=A0A4R6BIM0_9STAP|nr:FixH family protein [Macrococcus hajekii]TDM01493.1 hypothetical protein ERX37_08320 [Macrococcus hajekii]GGB00399.1 hypothetical protein GCM10007190_05620 [Macrococcus hajekii]
MKKLALILTAGLTLAACGQTQEKQNEKASAEESVQPVKVDLTVPEKGKVGEKVNLQAKVTQGGKAIDDADEVMFEIIKDGESDHSVKKMVKESKEGVYSLPYIFNEDDSYKVISHVTAKNQHTMPDKTIVIGDTKAATHEHEHHHEGSVHIMPITAEKNKEVNLMIHVEDKDGQAKKDLMTRLEVKQPDGTVKWVDLKETHDGQYEGTETFEQQGKYEVTAHAESKDGFHVHNDSIFTIK